MSASVDQVNENLTNIETDTIGEILNISMGAAATAISVMLNRQVSITTPIVDFIKSDSFDYKQLEPAIGVEINYIEGLHGSNLLVMSVTDVKKIVSCLLGESDIDENKELDEIHISALGEVMNQMMGSASTALATFFDKSVNISPPLVIEPNAFYENFFANETSDTIATVSFKFVIDGLIDSQFVTVLPIAFAKEMVNNAMHFGSSDAKEADVQTDFGNVTGHTQITQPIYADEIPLEKAKPQQPSRRESAPPPPSKPKEPKKNVNVQTIQFDHFDDNGAEYDSPDQMNLDLVMGVEVNVTVEIGHTKKLVKDVLNIAKGSIIELDKQAGDPVDVIVNGQLIAKGDVVVIDDYFGVRITKVLNGKN